MCCFRIETSLGWRKCHKNFPTSPKETQQLVSGKHQFAVTPLFPWQYCTVYINPREQAQ